MKLLAIVFVFLWMESSYACKMTPIGGSQKIISAALNQIVENKELAFYRVERIDAMGDVLITLRGDDGCKQFNFELLDIAADCSVKFRPVTEQSCATLL